MSNTLVSTRILLGVTGGVAAFKACDLARLLTKAGCDVRVVMTTAATKFITPLTFQALSGKHVHTALFCEQEESGMSHIELARWAEVVLVAPATADFMARLAYGHADDLLSTLCLATQARLFLAPAMNHRMWSNPATQTNRSILASRGITLLGPGEGDQACGESGLGRMLEPAEIMSFLRGKETGPLTGVRVTITAGPTREPIDPVRTISNRSSGRMGFAIAAAAHAAGAEVTLIAGPVALPTPQGITRIDVETTADMRHAVMSHIATTDLFIATAAVADYRPVKPSHQKLKKNADSLELTLVRTPDILSEVSKQISKPFCVGFAAETDNLIEYAQSKLVAKNLDMIAANKVGPALGIEQTENALEVLWPGGRTSLPLAPKESLARDFMAIVADHYRLTHPAQEDASSYEKN